MLQITLCSGLYPHTKDRLHIAHSAYWGPLEFSFYAISHTKKVLYFQLQTWLGSFPPALNAEFKLGESQALSEGAWLFKAFLQHTGGCHRLAVQPWREVRSFSPHAGLLLSSEHVPVKWGNVKHSERQAVCSFSLWLWPPWKHCLIEKFMWIANIGDVHFSSNFSRWHWSTRILLQENFTQDYCRSTTECYSNGAQIESFQIQCYFLF